MGREEIIKQIEKFKNRLSKKLDVEKMIVFGSVATGKFTKDSDIDLIIVSKSFRKKPFHKRALGFHDLAKMNYPFDFICLSPEEYKKMRKGITIVSLAEKEGIVI